ncbi:helix-turn-helix transcriptional regulator [Amycolatopsis suaedae]|uniref:helix-turn-helix transcriptional regulator n=1 Tax=Amycolatopsis suaedae TaxID=2510978 RepID=UPI0013EF53B2|nr:response regulator transcription factor [Amycolatopsis suaedae]
MKVLLDGADDLCWAWSCADLDSAIRQSMARRPDVVAVESDILVGSAYFKPKTADRLADTVVALVSEAHHVQKLLKLGIRYMISRAVHPTDFADLLRRAHYGGALVPLVPRQIRDHQANQEWGRQGDRSDAALTGRQLRILQLISFGLSNNEIAATLTISPETVRTHVKNLYRILDVKNRAHAVTVAYARGVLDAHRVS